MSFKPQVKTLGDEKFYGNALAFATFDEAYLNARDLSHRWMLVTDYRAVESDEPVTHTYVDGVLGDAVKEAT
jgi:hypothetical protein